MKAFVMIVAAVGVCISTAGFASSEGAASGANPATSPVADSSSRPAHFRPKPSVTMEQAKAQLRESNARLKTLLNGPLGNAEMLEVHQLSYTLEEALKKLSEETVRLAATLEEVHLASEKLDRDALARHGRDYLEHADRLLR